MARVKTGIGKSKRELKSKLGRLKKFVDANKGELSAKDRAVFTAALFNMSKAYTLLNKIPCIQPEMSIPFADYKSAGRTRKAKARRVR